MITSSRMKARGLPGAFQVMERTYRHLSDRTECTSAGPHRSRRRARCRPGCSCGGIDRKTVTPRQRLEEHARRPHRRALAPPKGRPGCLPRADGDAMKRPRALRTPCPAAGPRATASSAHQRTRRRPPVGGSDVEVPVELLQLHVDLLDAHGGEQPREPSRSGTTVRSDHPAGAAVSTHVYRS